MKWALTYSGWDSQIWDLDDLAQYPTLNWYAASIETATKYNIITGYGKGKFGTTDKITREQAMSMVARAMNITGLQVNVDQEEMQKLLTAFGDASQSSKYAQSSIATCIK